MRDLIRPAILTSSEISGQIAEVGAVIVLTLAGVVIGIDVLLLTNEISPSINIFEVGLAFVVIAQIFGALTVFDLMLIGIPALDIPVELEMTSGI